MALEQVRRERALDKSEFHDRLRSWLAKADDVVIGPEGVDGRTGWVYVRDGSDLFVLHADTPRNAVQAYLQLVAQFGDGIEWEIAESQRGKMTAVVYGPQKMRLRSFYLYAAGAVPQ